MNDLYTQDGIIEKNVLLERYIPLVRHEATSFAPIKKRSIFKFNSA
ncbi:hypothetical protein [Candidatus Arsenophonus triatominarum]|nr:hypothetical protein [Candidatus Arsenophonus triatominarum]